MEEVGEKPAGGRLGTDEESGPTSGCSGSKKDENKNYHEFAMKAERSYMSVAND